MPRPSRFIVAFSFALLIVTRLHAQVSFERLRAAANEPGNWLTYSGDYASHRYSRLTQIAPSNVKQLGQQWMFQAQVAGPWQTTPLVVDGVMYVTQRPNDVVALDAATGRAFWVYRHTPSADQRACCGANNRGLAILGDTLFMGTLDAHLVAIDTKNGRPLWKVEVASIKEQAHSITMAPLVIKDKVIVGVGGGDLGARGFLAAFDPKTGKELWRFNTIPGPGEPGHDTWPDDSWKHGGGPLWLTGSYDPTLNLTYWGVGNPGPDFNSDQRRGDNLYSDSVIALDPDTGKLKWHFQFTPNDGYDYDAVQIPVLADLNISGSPRKVMLWGNRNGFFYVLDRATGEFLNGKPFVKVNWASGLDARGRPIQTPQPQGQPTWPGTQGGTNWYSPSYSPRTGLFYLSVWDNYGSVYDNKRPAVFESGRAFTGGTTTTYAPSGGPALPMLRRGPVNSWTEAVGNGVVMAIDPQTGREKWRFTMTDVTDSGILTTATDLLFTGNREGYLQALDARTGALLWRATLGGQIVAGPISYEVGGRQFVSIVSGNVLVAYALPGS